MIKKVFLVFFLLVISLIEITMYVGNHFYYRAKEKTKDPKQKIYLLKKAKLFNPFNYNIYYKLGKANLELAEENLLVPKRRDSFLEKSIYYFSKAIKINPFYLFSHFNLAQSYFNYKYPSRPHIDKAYNELKKTAYLTYHNYQALFEIAKIYFSQWAILSQEDREFTYKILKRVLSSRNENYFKETLNIWFLYVRDYTLIKEITPDDSHLLYIYADFLGEKGLPIIERWNALSRAEYAVFKDAEELYQRAFSFHNRFSYEDSFPNFQKSLKGLQKITFYQNLTGEEFIDKEKYQDLVKNIYFYLGDYYLNYEEDSDQTSFYFEKYLDQEKEYSKLKQFRDYLEENDLIKVDFNNLKLLYLNLYTFYKVNQFREVIRIGKLMEDNILVISPKIKTYYLKILNLIGDSYLKLGYFFNAQEIYHKILDIESKNIEALVKLEQIYTRLNEEEKLKNIESNLESLIMKREIVINQYLTKKKKKLQIPLILKGEEANLEITLFIDRGNKNPAPLISIFFNDQVAKEFYLQNNNEIIPLKLNSKIGVNILEISALNCNDSIVVERLTLIE
ncbi:MAG: hypothetical protein ACE5WD_06295 [Candidatus Aminicenantia bacterium]